MSGGRPARPGLSRAVTLLMLSGLVAAIAGCSTQVPVAPAPSAALAVCAQAPWPQTVAGSARVDTDPAGPGVAAWGDPAIIARCGVSAVPPTTAECLGVDDVDWVVEPLQDGRRFTTYGRAPAMQVLVPDHYSPEALVLGAFTQVASTLPANGRHCSAAAPRAPRPTTSATG